MRFLGSVLADVLGAGVGASTGVAVGVFGALEPFKLPLLILHDVRVQVDLYPDEGQQNIELATLSFGAIFFLDAVEHDAVHVVYGGLARVGVDYEVLPIHRIQMLHLLPHYLLLLVPCHLCLLAVMSLQTIVWFSTRRALLLVYFISRQVLIML